MIADAKFLGYRIATLKGLIPSVRFTSPDGGIPSFGNKGIIETTGSIMKYPEGIDDFFPFVGLRRKQVNLYEWKLPKGWQIKGVNQSNEGTFYTTNLDVKIITDYFSQGDISVRGVNDIKSAYSDTFHFGIDETRGLKILKAPDKIDFGKNKTYTYQVTAVPGIIYTWEAPSGWKINGGGNILTGENINSITVIPFFCSLNDTVRLSFRKEDEISDWYIMPGRFNGNPDIKIGKNEAVYQCEEQNLTLDIPDSSSVQNVTWSGDGMLIVKGQGTLNPIVIFTRENVEVTAMIQMKGCNNVFSRTKTFNILPHRIKILGPWEICKEGDFSVGKLSNGLCVRWETTSPSTIEYKSSNGSEIKLTLKVLDDFLLKAIIMDANNNQLISEIDQQIKIKDKLDDPDLISICRYKFDPNIYICKKNGNNINRNWDKWELKGVNCKVYKMEKNSELLPEHNNYIRVEHTYNPYLGLTYIYVRYVSKCGATKWKIFHFEEFDDNSCLIPEGWSDKMPLNENQNEEEEEEPPFFVPLDSIGIPCFVAKPEELEGNIFLRDTYWINQVHLDCSQRYYKQPPFFSQRPFAPTYDVDVAHIKEFPGGYFECITDQGIPCEEVGFNFDKTSGCLRFGGCFHTWGKFFVRFVYECQSTPWQLVDFGNIILSNGYLSACSQYGHLPSPPSPPRTTPSFFLYPNPATDIVTVKMIENKETDSDNCRSCSNNFIFANYCEIELYSTTALIRRYKTNQSSFQIPISDLSRGVYFIRVKKVDGYYTKKLLKN